MTKLPREPLYRKLGGQRDIDRLRNEMARGNYPLGMTDCEVVGINGDCGPECPVALRGECEFIDEAVEKYPEMANEPYREFDNG